MSLITGILLMCLRRVLTSCSRLQCARLNSKAFCTYLLTSVLNDRHVLPVVSLTSMSDITLLSTLIDTLTAAKPCADAG